MQLKRFTDLGLRILMYLAQNSDDVKASEPVSITELSEKLNWNKNLVVKVAHFMVQAGWLAAARGRTGGLMLSENPEDYKIGDIVRALEADEYLINCGEPLCPFIKNCALIGVLDEAHEAFFASLNRHTLASLIEASTHKDAVVQLYRKAC